jgi:hypothetical protein
MAPNLIDNYSKNFINYSLMEMHHNKVTNYNFVLNFVILLTMILITSITLYCLYKGKRSDEEKEIQSFKDKQYILSKIRAIQEQQVDTSQITNLPPINTINEY